ncbi:hypothetical protein ACSV4D_14185 [Flavobacterium sp. ARAG 55.4]|uniref:hypothetical protein n=1 Tax=Flavobacterium sp. ARAG 55.4 TaxID=3451357 RepID=UPI003F451FC7
MAKAVLSNKNCFLIYFFWLVTSLSFLQAQDKKTIADVEKIYLHTDRTRYFVGEDLWYKAYNVRAYNNILFDNSNILYVELISPNSKIIARNKTNLEMGLGNGDFQLQDSLGVKPGVYQLRAYTNWNRNFGEDFIFKKNIEIIDVFESHSNASKKQNAAIENKIIKTFKGNNFKLEFFPEGGSLIENVASLKQGYIISFRAMKGRNILSITTNEATLAQNPNPLLMVVCKSKGISYLETEFTIKQTVFSFELPRDKAPDGISQITVYDSNAKPQSERLIYIEKDHDLEVQLVTDKESYTPKEKAIINISSKTKAGVAKPASFSLSVTDMNGETEDKYSGSNISSYFLMESDIRGKVHHPGDYFDANNPKRLEHLDNLLLTQGWRDFVWKTMPQSMDSISYKAEKGITISGRVKQLLGEKPLININLTLALINKKHMNIFNTVTDANGGFKFENMMFSGKTNMFLNSRNEKGKFRGEIIVNPIEQTPVAVSFQKEAINWTDPVQKVVDHVFKKNVAFGIQPENILDEVKITAKKEKHHVQSSWHS